MLHTIPNEASFDRDFINKLFVVFFPESYIQHQLKKEGVDRKSILNVLRDKKRYETAKGKIFMRIYNGTQMRSDRSNIYIILLQIFQACSKVVCTQMLQLILEIERKCLRLHSG